MISNQPNNRITIPFIHSKHALNLASGNKFEIRLSLIRHTYHKRIILTIISRQETFSMSKVLFDKLKFYWLLSILCKIIIYPKNLSGWEFVNYIIWFNILTLPLTYELKLPHKKWGLTRKYFYSNVGKLRSWGSNSILMLWYHVKSSFYPKT
jgi:hypothetical protein